MYELGGVNNFGIPTVVVVGDGVVVDVDIVKEDGILLLLFFFS